METNSKKEAYFATVYRRITLKTIDGETIAGKINLSSKQRVSDIFTRGDNPFIVLVDAVAKDVVGKTLFINKEHIIWVEPDDEG